MSMRPGTLCAQQRARLEILGAAARLCECVAAAVGFRKGRRQAERRGSAWGDVNGHRGVCAVSSLLVARARHTFRAVPVYDDQMKTRGPDIRPRGDDVEGHGKTVLACSCEGTMRLDAELLGTQGGALRLAHQLCRADTDLLRNALASGGDVVVAACRQETPLFAEVAEETGAEARLRSVNIRETAGWSSDAARAGPKMAALIAAAAEPAPAVPIVAMESRGVALVYGRDETAIDVAGRLAAHLDITVLLSRPGEVAPPRLAEFPVLKGTIAAATGHLGAFSLRIDDYALPAPSSRAKLVFGPSRDGATSTCDLVLDLSGGAPLFPAHELRSGYLRADPRDGAAVERLVFEASHLVGEFDKPRFVDFHAHLCAHSRSRITGCTRCLEVCPTGAIAPAGDTVGYRHTHLRRLRLLRVRLPDGRGRLRSAARRRAHAHAAGHAAHLS
jgi:ferredoxin